MSKLKDVFNILFKISYGKTVIFIIIFTFFLAFFLFRNKNVYIGVFVTCLGLFLIAVNYMQPQEPYFSNSSKITLGNQSNNISQNNYDRLEYIADNFVICKRTVQPTPSRWDIDDLDLDNNRNFWRTQKVRPYWDTHINSSGDWTWIHCELYYPVNGIGPLGEKHTHDYEFIDFFFYKNETEPKFVGFPTFVGFTDHPRVLLSWDKMPRLGELYVLKLCPDTNAFAEDYDTFPIPSRNFRPTFVAPAASDSFKYLSEFEKMQIYGSFFAFIFLFSYCYVTHNFRPRYYLLLLVCALFGTYYLFVLQFDYVGNPSFRVWQDGQHYDDTPWQDSKEGRDYIDDYGGLPHDRGRWAEPSFDNEIGIKI